MGRIVGGLGRVVPKATLDAQAEAAALVAGARAEADEIRAQTKAVLDRIEKCLTTAGSSMEKALKCNVYLRHLEDYAAMNEVYRGRFGGEPPVRTTLAVAGIPLEGCLIEIELIAAR